MHFDRENFNKWFKRDESELSVEFVPVMPPKTLGHLIMIPVFFLTFGLVLVPMALFDSIRLRS